MKISAKADYAVRLAADLGSLRTAGLVASRRGAEGGYYLAHPPSQVTVADVIRAVDGPLAAVHGDAPETVSYLGPAARLADVWIAVRASLREVLEGVTLADLASGKLPARVEKLASRPEARKRR